MTAKIVENSLTRMFVLHKIERGFVDSISNWKILVSAYFDHLMGRRWRADLDSTDFCKSLASHIVACKEQLFYYAQPLILAIFYSPDFCASAKGIHEMENIIRQIKGEPLVIHRSITKSITC